MGIASTITHRLLTLSRSSLILNRGLNACIIPAFIGASRTAASAAAAKKIAAATTPKTPPKASGVKATVTKAASGAKTAAKKPAKPKAAAKKPVKKAAAKKELTDEQKKNLLIKNLRMKALDPPPRSPLSAYLIYFTEQKKGKMSSTQIAEQWRLLSQEEKDTYAKKAAAKGPARLEAFKEWIERTSPFDIRLANKARRRLKALGRSSGITQIPDDRLPKRISRPSFIYTSEQYASGRKFLDAEGKNSVVVGNKVLTEEYEKLPASEKKRFEALVEKNKKDYEDEMARLGKQWEAQTV